MFLVQCIYEYFALTCGILPSNWLLFMVLKAFDGCGNKSCYFTEFLAVGVSFEIIPHGFPCIWSHQQRSAASFPILVLLVAFFYLIVSMDTRPPNHTVTQEWREWVPNLIEGAAGVALWALGLCGLCVFVEAASIHSCFMECFF